jgi:hypothetical protein
MRVARVNLSPSFLFSHFAQALPSLYGESTN